MNYLIDTHTFLWAISDDDRLSDAAKNIIEKVDQNIHISIASLWEISIKISIDKLELDEAFETLVPRELYNFEIKVIDIEIDHLSRLSSLPLHHRDPFDRLIISQSLEENYPVIGRDNKFDSYKVNRIW